MHIKYDANTPGGQVVAEVVWTLQRLDQLLRNAGDMIEAVGSANLESHDMFNVEVGSGTAFNDSFLQLRDAFDTFYGDGTDGTNREKASRFMRRGM